MAALAAAGSSGGGSSTSETEARDLQQARSASLVHTDDRWVRAVLEGLQPEGTWKRDLPSVAPEHRANEKEHQRQLECWARRAFEVIVSARALGREFTFGLEERTEDLSVPTPNGSLHKPDVVDQVSAPHEHHTDNASSSGRGWHRAGLVIEVKPFVTEGELSHQVAQLRRYAHAVLEAQPSRNYVLAALVSLSTADDTCEARARVLLMLREASGMHECVLSEVLKGNDASTQHSAAWALSKLISAPRHQLGFRGLPPQLMYDLQMEYTITFDDDAHRACDQERVVLLHVLRCGRLGSPYDQQKRIVKPTLFAGLVRRNEPGDEGTPVSVKALLDGDQLCLLEGSGAVFASLLTHEQEALARAKRAATATSNWDEPLRFRGFDRGWVPRLVGCVNQTKEGVCAALITVPLSEPLRRELSCFFRGRGTREQPPREVRRRRLGLTGNDRTKVLSATGQHLQLRDVTSGGKMLHPKALVHECICDLYSTLRALHTCAGMLHGDVHPPNVLPNANGIDFGLADLEDAIYADDGGRLPFIQRFHGTGVYSATRVVAFASDDHAEAKALKWSYKWRDDLESLYFLLWDLLDPSPLPWAGGTRLKDMFAQKMNNLLGWQKRRRDDQVLTGEDAMRRRRESEEDRADVLVDALKSCADSLFGCRPALNDVRDMTGDWPECQRLEALEKLCEQHKEQSS